MRGATRRGMTALLAIAVKGARSAALDLLKSKRLGVN